MQQIGKDVYKLSEGFHTATNKVSQTQHVTEDYWLVARQALFFFFGGAVTQRGSLPPHS